MCGQAQEKLDGRCRGGNQDVGNKMLEEKRQDREEWIPVVRQALALEGP